MLIITIGMDVINYLSVVYFRVALKINLVTFKKLKQKEAYYVGFCTKMH